MTNHTLANICRVTAGAAMLLAVSMVCRADPTDTALLQDGRSAMAPHVDVVAADVTAELAHYRWWLGAALTALLMMSGVTLYTMHLNRRMAAASGSISFAAHSLHFSDGALLPHAGQKHWAKKLNRAVAENRFRLDCEPFIPIIPGAAAIKHYEILLRLVEKDGREVSPRSFIPAAETLHLMPVIDRWVVATTFAAVARYATAADDAATLPVLAINLSGQSLGDDEFLGFLVAQFDQSRVDPTRICFEITETAAIANMPRALRMMNILRGMGCRFALDDFGSGLSSFAYLKNMPVDYLKIDGAFLRDGLDDPVSYAIVDSINQIGRLMGLKTVAECVPDAKTLERVKAIGADYAQGHGLAQTKKLDDVLRDDAAILAAARVA